MGCAQFEYVISISQLLDIGLIDRVRRDIEGRIWSGFIVGFMEEAVSADSCRLHRVGD